MDKKPYLTIDDVEKCKTCYKPMVPIFGNSRTLWCPDCEGHSKQKDKPKRRQINFLGDDYPNFKIKDDDDKCGGCGGGCSCCGHI